MLFRVTVKGVNCNIKTVTMMQSIYKQATGKTLFKSNSLKANVTRGLNHPKTFPHFLQTKFDDTSNNY